MSSLRTVAIGDSVMWGQGNRRDHTFVALASRRIAELAGLEWTNPEMLARSGAQFSTGSTRDEERDARKSFIELYPELFATDAERAMFLAGAGPTPSTKLFGEIPSSFPTITDQLRLARELPDRLRVGLVFLNGGANDVDFVQAINPRSGMSVEDVSRKIYETMQLRLVPALREARRLFGRAVIIVPGYHRLLSSLSSIPKLKSLAKHASGYGFYVDALHALSFVPVVNFLSSEADDMLDEAARGMIERADFAHAIAMFWQARIVHEVSQEPGMRGPGMLFVSGRIDKNNSLFATGPSFIWDQYDPAGDPMRDARIDQNPRSSVSKELERLLRPFNSSFPNPGRESLEALQNLQPKLGGPVPLVNAVSEAITRLSNPQTDGGPALDEKLLRLVRLELQRQEVVKIASLLHPNEAGAEQYAGQIVEAWRGHRDASHFSERVGILRSSMGAPSDDAALIAYGLDPAAPKGETARFFEVDSLAINVETRQGTSFKEAFLVLPNAANQRIRLDTVLRNVDERRTVYTNPRVAGWGSNMRVEFDTGLDDGGEEFRPGSFSLFAFDHMGRIALWSLAGARLEINPGGRWAIGSIELFVNGRRVAARTFNWVIQGGESRSLLYPAEVPSPRTGRLDAPAPVT